MDQVEGLPAGPNNFQYNDHSLNGNFHLESVTSVSLSDDPVINPPPGASFDPGPYGD